MMSNPATLPEFWDSLPIRSASFSLGGAVVSSRTEGGDTITARRGTRLWSGSVALAPRSFRDAEALKARLTAIADAGQSFLCYPMPIYSTAHDPAGAVTSATIYNIPASGVELRLGTLPTGYTVRGGEFLSFTYGSSPVRHALHQVVDGVWPAGVEGRPATFEVRPAVRSGAVANAPVRLFKPTMAAIIVPGSIGWGNSEGNVTSGISFSIIQTLRG